MGLSDPAAIPCMCTPFPARRRKRVTPDDICTPLPRVAPRSRRSILLPEAGVKEVRRRVDEKTRYTMVFLAAPADDGLVRGEHSAPRRDAPWRATYIGTPRDNGEGGAIRSLPTRSTDIYGHVRIKLMKAGGTITAPPPRRGDGVRALAPQAPDRALKRAPGAGAKEPGPPCRTAANGEAMSPPVGATGASWRTA